MGERIKCKKCGDILQSKYRHDFQMCKCGSCYIDGGDDYCRVGGEKEDIEWIDRNDKKQFKYLFDYCEEILNKKIYFISDTHFNHKNIIKYCSRPFKDVEEMNKVLIENWNNTVTDFDTIFHLGDVALTNESEMKEIVPKLKGKKILIKGNHDKKSKEFFRSVGFEIIPDNPLKLDMMCKYKLKTLDDVRKYKESKRDELKNLYNERNRLYYKRKALDEGTEKDAVTEEIIKVTDKIKKVKRELFYCDDIVERTNKILEEIKFIEEEKWNKQNEKNKVKNKKKVR